MIRLCDHCGSLSGCDHCAGPVPHAMGRKIVDMEARRNRAGELAVYKIPSGDGGGTVEVAGINDRYHPEQCAHLAALIRAGDHDKAEDEAARYLEKYTDGVRNWLSGGPASVEFFLRDCAFNRGPIGAAVILQMALGFAGAGVDGKVGPATRGRILDALGEDATGAELLVRLLLARQSYEYEVARRNTKNKFWAGLTNRWVMAYQWAQRLACAVGEDSWERPV